MLLSSLAFCNCSSVPRRPTLSSGPDRPAPTPSLAQGPAPAPAPTSPTGGGPAFAPAPALPGLDCTDALLNLSSCLTYVEQGSNATVPDKGCCPSLSSLVGSRPLCLCQLLSDSDAFGVQIDTTKALMLPTACRVQTPPLSLCAVAGIPVASTTGSMSPAPASGGPVEPGTTASATPVAAPPNHSAAGTISGASGLPAAGTLSIVVAAMSLI